MTVAATAASLLCNVTLVVDYVRVKDFRHSGSGLTEKQRSLVIAVMILLCYIGLGSLCFSFLISELTCECRRILMDGRAGGQLTLSRIHRY